MSNRYEVVTSIPDGGYAKDDQGEWFVRPPGCPFSASVKNHTVTEHEDGTITVDPSILYDVPEYDPPYHYHGYLEHGVWRAV